METYLEIILACYFNAVYGNDLSPSQRFSKFFGTMQGVLSMILMPLVSFFVIFQEEDTLKLEWFKENFEAFF